MLVLFFKIGKNPGYVKSKSFQLSQFISNMRTAKSFTKLSRFSVPLWFSNISGSFYYGFTRASVNTYFFQFNNRHTRKRCKICLRLTIKTQQRHH